MKFLSPPDAGVGATPLIILAIIVLVVAAPVLLAVLRKRRSRVIGLRDCRWRRARGANPRPGFTEWRCKTCGTTAFSSDGKPPKECKRALTADRL